MEGTTTRRRILRRHEVEDRVALARSTIYKYIALGEFPEPIRLGGRAVGWVEHEIDLWVATRQRKNEVRA